MTAFLENNNSQEAKQKPKRNKSSKNTNTGSQTWLTQIFEKFLIYLVTRPLGTFIQLKI
jgi:hypothetical protein